MNLMQQRGSGFARIRDAMLNHGLDTPLYAQQDDYFVATLQGPNGNYERLKLPGGAVGFITPAVEAQLNARQKKIMVQVQQEGAVTSGWYRKTFDVTYDTANRDLLDLVERKLLIKSGQGRATHFKPKSPAS
jgi:predicted HTH transcriptional regulator